jgi:thiol:disulfide interchange protein DsbD
MIRYSRLLNVLLLITLLFVPVSFYSVPLPQTAADVKVSGSLKQDKLKRGGTTQASVTIEIPSGLHVQSNKPLDKFLVPTKLDIEAPQGVKIGPVLYPRARTMKLSFSKTPVSVYEGVAIIRFNVTVPANFGASSAEIKGRLKFQACNNDSCFPPQTREVKVGLNVE